MPKYKCIMAILCGFTLLICSQSLASETKLQLCDCYNTPTVDVEQFVTNDNNTIQSLTSSCKDNFMVTGITQVPEKDPQVTGQFLIISTIRCCRVCTN